MVAEPLGISLQLTQAQAATELLRRRRARESLVAFSQAIEIPGSPVSEDQDAWLFKPIETSVALHHRIMLEKVQTCLETEYGRLIIMAPPGSAKSTYVGVVTPAWALGKWGGYNIIYVSHSNPPAERVSRRTRQVCRSPLYQAIWEHKAILAKGMEGVREWKLTNDSTILNGGLESGITSSRADAAIIDDPIRGAEHANSEGQRVTTWNAYELDLKTRLKPHASIVLTMTRWNEQDTIGMLLPEDYHGQSGPVLCRDGMVWEVLNIPAEAEHADDPLGRKMGEMLWPEWFDNRHWAIYRKNSRLWTSLFQQRPSALNGEEFHREWFKRYTKRPDKWPEKDERRREMTWILSTDFAQTDVKQAAGGKVDWTRHGIFGMSSDDEVYYEAGIGFQKSPDKTIESAIDLVTQYRPIEWLIESGGTYNAWNGYIERRMKERTKAGEKAYTTLVKMPTNQNKILKAGAFRTMCEAGRVYVKEGPEGDAFIDECCAFPFGTWDDRVDMAGQVGRRADEIWAQEKPKPPVRKQIKPLSAAALEAVEIDREAEERRYRRFRG